MPKSPITAEQQRKTNLKIDRAPTWSGTQKIPMADRAVTRTAGDDMSPAFTAVSPRTMAPTIDNEIPIRRGIRIEA